MTGNTSARGNSNLDKSQQSSVISAELDISEHLRQEEKSNRNRMMVNNLFALNGLGYSGLPLNQQFSGASAMDKVRRQ